ncbi:MAG: FHA domain-containing protein [Nitrospinota bacterium]|nr:FHA domain-containing protein [Nitrospinota bacterium]
MKINYILETISSNGLRDRVVKSFDKNEIILGRGSDSDIRFSSLLVSFRHARLAHENKRLLIEELGDKAGNTWVNGHPAKKVFLASGDVIKMGDIYLEIKAEEGHWDIYETREEKTDEDQRKEIEDSLDKMDIVKRLPSHLVMALVVWVPLTLMFMIGPVIGFNPGAWEAGELIPAHKFLKTDCQVCHTDAFQPVPDRACEKCHTMGNHVTFLTEHPHLNEKCSFCHNEHNHDQNMVLSGSQICLKCHQLIKSFNPETIYPAIHGFNPSHPEFASVRQKRVDRAQLKLNHNYHLTSVEMEDPVTNTKRTMRCDDCHVMDSAGKYMEPVTFEKFCVSCHKLKLRGAAHMLRTPHVKTSLVRTFLKSPKDFLYEYIDGSPGSLLDTPKSQGRRRRGPLPQPVLKFKNEWVEKNFEKIEQQGGLLRNENEVYFSAQGGCIECHVLDFQPVGTFNPDSTQIALSLWSHSVRIWNTQTEKDEVHLKGHHDIVKSIVFSPDGRWILTGSRDFTARLWMAPVSEVPPSVGGEAISKTLEKQPAKSAEEESENVSPYAHLEIEPLHIFKKHSGAVNDAQFNPTLDKIVTASDDKTAIIWSLEDQKPVHILSGHSAPVIKTGFNPEGTLVFTLSEGHTAKIWDAETGKETTDLKFSYYEINDLGFQPGQTDRLAIALSNGTIKIISAREGTVIQTLKDSQEHLQNSGHRLEVTSLQFNAEGTRLLSLSRDLTAKVWDMNTGNVETTLIVWEKKTDPPAPKAQMFLTAEFNRDGTQIVTGSTDKMVRWWETDSGKLLKEKKGHENHVIKVSFNHSGSQALSVAANNTAALWNMESETNVSFRHDDIELQDNENELFPPETEPTQMPIRFFPMSFFSHKKHGFLECENCHEGSKESLLTSDLLTPSISPCRTCHEKNEVHLNQCSVCHYFHPERERHYKKGPLVPDHAAELGISFLPGKIP